jgi:hypothetical protein
MALVVLTIIFFGIPYLVDVAYCEDLTPAHFAQNFVFDGEEVDPSDDQACFVTLDHPIGVLAEIPPCLIASTQFGDLAQTVSSFKYLSVTWHASRPPPSTY